ncbi:hypothetical protein F4813DRAFT_374534 [Daldinia decipiens]|uniref:uncharacterized protein n=1 Tax=Daldinia decipiens TaxID=326647 RepID=UPI0020C2C32D|nr:uncharacterized protein F4813DRAFT_374534 [Daldinia decipiens]KAI1653379.1 hypothetical protein F4813DRAFT_374534 [Daldinia decipiens]
MKLLLTFVIAVPQGKVIYLHSQVDYLNDFYRRYPSFGIPELSLVCRESKRIVSKWGIGLRFCGFDKPIHCEWFDPRRDSIYIPSIHIFKRWHGWRKCMGGATVILNVLETVEDQYRGRLPSKAFKWAIQSGYFEGVRAIDLAMLTIKCKGVSWDKEHDAYGEGGDVGVVGLDDKRLPTMLRPIFNDIRGGYINRVESLQYMAHRRPSCLLKRLHGEWDRDLKFLFEEQWLFSQLRVSKEDQFESELFTDIKFGYQDRRRALNREHDTIRRLIAKMPEIRPVIVFDRTPTPVPEQSQDWPNHWDNRRGYDGLEVVSNRRGMVLAYNIYDGRMTQFT